MNKKRAFCVLRLTFLAFGASIFTQAQVSPSPASLTIEEVVKLQRAGFSEDVIITRIKKNGKAFDLSTDELVELHKIGINDRVIRFLLDPSQPYAAPATQAPSQPEPATPPKPSVPEKQYSEDDHASKVPPEPGLYLLKDQMFAKIDAKILLGFDEKGRIGGPLKKSKVITYLVGATAKIRASEQARNFYLRLAEGRAIEEIVLMSFARKGGRRELETGPVGKKQEFRAESMRAFDSLEVGQRLHRLTPAKLGAGEYLFFQLGSADPTKGSYGKGFDFGVDEPGGTSSKPTSPKH